MQLHFLTVTIKLQYVPIHDWGKAKIPNKDQILQLWWSLNFTWKQALSWNILLY